MFLTRFNASTTESSISSLSVDDGGDDFAGAIAPAKACTSAAFAFVIAA
jgi:hypothetical protein